MIDLATISIAIGMGVLGSAHCFSMCGGIASALSMQSTNTGNVGRRFLFSLFYSLGRITSYGVAGFLVGSIGFILSDAIGFYASLTMRLAAGLLIFMLGLAIAGWWQGINRIEQLGSVVWKKISPITAAFLPIDTLLKALVVGSLWGWLPCGLVYSALVWTSTQANPIHSALLMICFGLGTLPAVVGSGLLAQQLSSLVRNRGVRQVAGVLLIIFGIWTIAIALQHASHHGSDHQHDLQQQHEHHSTLQKTKTDNNELNQRRHH